MSAGTRADRHSGSGSSYAVSLIGAEYIEPRLRVIRKQEQDATEGLVSRFLHFLHPKSIGAIHQGACHFSDDFRLRNQSVVEARRVRTPDAERYLRVRILVIILPVYVGLVIIYWMKTQVVRALESPAPSASLPRPNSRPSWR